MSYPWEKGYKQQPLNPMLYTPAQVAMSQAQRSGDHQTVGQMVAAARDIQQETRELHDVSVRTVRLSRDLANPVSDQPPGTWTCVKCQAVLPADGPVSHCPACHLTFKSLAGFDDHRMSIRKAPWRRCRTETEIRRRGYEPNEKGYWRKPRPVGTLPQTAGRPVSSPVPGTAGPQ